MPLKENKKRKIMQLSEEIDEIVCVIDKIGSGFETTENMSLALALFFKERGVLDKLSHIRRFLMTELSKNISSAEYDEWIEKEISFWNPPYKMTKDELIKRIKE
ncbi:MULTISPECIES: hypothetical protein [Bacteroidaceae]|jgi:hypothetical protein|nr:MULTISPECIES: hypothetical protein [Bacteroidaceae]